MVAAELLQYVCGDSNVIFIPDLNALLLCTVNLYSEKNGGGGVKKYLLHELILRCYICHY